MNDYFPKSNAQQVTWLTNFKNKIAIHGPALGLTKEEIESNQDYCNDAISKINAVDVKKTELKAAVKSRDEVLKVKARDFRTKIARFKTAPGFAKSIGEELGVVSSIANMDKTAYKAVIGAELFAGSVRIKFVKKGVDGVSIYHRKKGELAWQFLTRNSKSPYNDKITLATTGQPEHWEYRAYGVINDIEIGQPSDIVEIVFGG
jgi:hypothetical protein